MADVCRNHEDRTATHTAEMGVARPPYVEAVPLCAECAPRIETIGFPVKALPAADAMACCPKCDAPLVMTFERAGLEFICVPCNRWYEFFGPTPRTHTAELQARHDELKEQYLEARRSREPEGAT